MEKYTITLDIGGTKIYGTLMDTDGNILQRDKKKTRTQDGVEGVTGQIFKVIEALLEKSQIPIEGIQAIGAGAPGVIDLDRGIILSSPNLPWKNFRFSDMIKERYGFPAFLGNDATLGMLGEWNYGAARGKQHVIGFFVGTGIGGAILINGMLYHGTKGSAAEIGHMIVNPEGPYCGCGARGCLEAYASKTAIQREIENQLKRGRKSTIAEPMKEDVLLRGGMIRKALQENDALVIEVMERAVYYLSVGVASLINIMNPEMIILGGGLSEAVGDWILPRLKAKVGRFALAEILAATEIVQSSLGDDAINYGALVLLQSKMKE